MINTLQQRNVQFSAIQTGFVTTSTTKVDVTNIAISSFTTSGGPVALTCVTTDTGDTGAQTGRLGSQNITTSDFNTNWLWVRDGTTIATMTHNMNIDGNVATLFVPHSMLFFIDNPGAGNFAYKLQVYSTSSNVSAVFTNGRMVVYEL